mgnify:CR=1 FL=1
MLWLSVAPAVVPMPAPSLGCDFKCSSTGAADGQPRHAPAKLDHAGFVRREFGVVEEFQARERDVGAMKTSAPIELKTTHNQNALLKSLYNLQ